MSVLPAGKTVVWHLAGDAWALYTGDPEVAEAARKGGLRRMAEYYNLKEEGKLIAWQFVGPKEKVLAVAGGTILTPAGEREDEDEGEVPPGGNVDRAETPKRRRGQGEGGSAPEQLRLF